MTHHVLRNMGRGGRGRGAAFTLLELLVVTSVVGLLAAVLIPALGEARSAGRSSVCIAALHQAGLGMTMYLDDNDGWFWPYYKDVSGPDGGRRWWFGFEPGGPSSNPLQTGRRLDRAAGFLGKYLSAGAEDFRCPSFPSQSGLYFRKFEPSAGGFGYNTGALGGYNWISSATSGTGRAAEFAGRSADVFALADGIHFDRLDYSSGGTLDQPFNEPAYIQWQEPSLFDRNVGVNGGFAHFRHGKQAQVLYLDGHAARQPLRRANHPYGKKGFGPIGNLADESLGVTEIRKGNLTLRVDRIYGLR